MTSNNLGSGHHGARGSDRKHFRTLNVGRSFVQRCVSGLGWCTMFSSGYVIVWSSFVYFGVRQGVWGNRWGSWAACGGHNGFWG